MTAAASAVLATVLLLFDTVSKPLAFEVASVKPAKIASSTGGSERPGMAMVISGSPSQGAHGRLEYRSVTLQVLLQRAFGLKEYQIVGPAWLQTEQYQVAATYPEGTNPEQVSEMLVTLVAERFRLKTHREQRERSVYVLISENGLTKIQRAEGDTTSLSVSMGDRVRRISGQVNAANLISALTKSVDRPIEDRTGIEGSFNIKMEWAQSADATGADGAPLPSLFAALHEQLGLRLVPEKAMTDILVVDSAERQSTGN